MMTADEIFEAAENNETIYWSNEYATKVCRNHGLDLADYLTEYGGLPTQTQVDAANLLGWMGY